MSIVAILASGLMGTAVTWHVADNGHEGRLVSTHLDAEIIRLRMDGGYNRACAGNLLGV